MSNIVIRKSQVNNVVMTLSERSDITDPFYLVVFNSKYNTDGEVKSLSVQDSSSYKIRYNLLEIEEKSNPIPLSGEVYFPDVGEWSYEVYESQTQTLNIEDTTGRVLQRGLLIVK